MREDRRSRYDDGFRREALALIKAGAGRDALARRLAMPAYTARNWIRLYRSNGEGRRGARPRRERHDQDGGHGQALDREHRGLATVC